MKTGSVLAALLLVVGMGEAEAQIYKCVDPTTGKTTFSQTDCASGQKRVVIDGRVSHPSTSAPQMMPLNAPSIPERVSAPAAHGTAPAASVASNCRPLPPQELVARRRDLQTALASRSNSQERDEALRLELRFLEMEEQYDMLASHLVARRADENTRVTSLVDSTRQEAIRALRQIHRLRWDWDEVPDASSPDGFKLACRSRTTGEFGPDRNCECKPRVRGRWRKT